MKRLTIFLFALAILSLSACKEETKVPEVPKESEKETVKSTAEKEISHLGKLISVSNVNEAGKDAVDFVFELNGKKQSFFEYTKDKYVLLNVWGTWCPPCRKEIPDLVEIGNEEKDWLLVGIVVDRNPRITADEQIPGVKSFMDANNMNYLNIVGDGQTVGQLIANYGGVQGVPTTFYIDKNNKIANMNVGGLPKTGFISYMRAVDKK